MVNSMFTKRIAPILKEPKESISIPCIEKVELGKLARSYWKAIQPTGLSTSNFTKIYDETDMSSSMSN